jgi:hypothetical protein
VPEQHSDLSGELPSNLQSWGSSNTELMGALRFDVSRIRVGVNNSKSKRYREGIRGVLRPNAARSAESGPGRLCPTKICDLEANSCTQP